MYDINAITLSDYTLTETEKKSSDYLVAYTDWMIADLVLTNSPSRLKFGKMRDMYEGIRDESEFQYLKDNKGIGNAADLKFRPIIRNRIDVLIGLLSSATFDYKVSVMDQDTLGVMMQEKVFAHLQEVYAGIDDHIKRSKFLTQLDPNAQPGQATVPLNIKNLIQETKEKVDKEWRSVFVHSCNNMLKYFQEDIDIDMLQKRKLLFEDLCVIGKSLYRVRAMEKGKMPEFEALIPENAYYRLRRDQKYIKQAQRMVYVKYMTKTEILTMYGHLLKPEDMEDLFALPTITRAAAINSPALMERVAREMKGDKQSIMDADVLEVYECEWIANNPYDIDTEITRGNLLVDGPVDVSKKRWRQDRYQSIRIGADIYVDMGKSTYIVRSKKDSDKCYLTFNGIQYSDRSGEPYSLCWKAKDVQDDFDILRYHRDNLIANSGVKGSNMNYEAIPEFLDPEPVARIMKFIAYKKQGISLVSPSQDGAKDFNNYGAFDDSLDGNSITAINATLQMLDDDASAITGVTPQMMGLIEQREAVSNAKLGVSQASLVTKNLFDHHDVLTKHLITDLIQGCQLTLNSGYTGSFTTSSGVSMFNLMPEYFCYSDYNIHVTSASNEYAKKQEIRQMIPVLINAKIIAPDIVFKIMMQDSVSDMVYILDQSMKESNNFQKQIENLSNQNAELKKESEQALAQLKKFDQFKHELESKKLDLDSFKAKNTYELAKDANDINREHKERDIELKLEGIKLERDQLYLGIGQERKINEDKI